MFSLVETTDDVLWNTFLEEEKDKQWVTIAHNPCLGKVVSKTYGYGHKKYLIMDGEQVVGVLPTSEIGGKIVSMPHFSYGGPLFKKGAQNIGAFDLAAVFPDKKFEIRSFAKWSTFYTDKKICCILKMEENEEDQMMGIKPKLRQKIRKCLRQGYTVKSGKAELLDDFYTTFSRRMLQFGSPPLGKKFFKDLLDEYEHGDVQITAIYDDNKVISAGFSLSYLGFNELCWSGTDDAYNNLNVNAMLFWEMIKTSMDKGHSFFSFGRSTIDSSQHFYKKLWNPIQVPIYYNLSEEPGGSIRDLEFLTKIWKLQPLRTSQVLGHIVSKHIY